MEDTNEKIETVGRTNHVTSDYVFHEDCKKLLVDKYFEIPLVFKLDKLFAEGAQYPHTHRNESIIYEYTHQALKFYSQVFTVLSAVECLPFIVIYVLALDMVGFATWLVFVYFWMAIISQLFKRVTYRNRPWRCTRAQSLWQEDQSSSFPSRSALIGMLVPMSWTIYYGYGGWILGFVGFLSVAFARVYLGAHFFSDCFFAYGYGVALLYLCWFVYSAFGLEQIWEYFRIESSNTQLYLLASGGFMMVVSQIICSKKLHFWTKGEMVLGNFTGAIMVSLAKGTNSHIPFDLKKDLIGHLGLVVVNGIMVFVFLQIFPALKKIFGGDSLSKALYFMVATLLGVLMYFINVILMSVM